MIESEADNMSPRLPRNTFGERQLLAEHSSQDVCATWGGSKIDANCDPPLCFQHGCGIDYAPTLI